MRFAHLFAKFAGLHQKLPQVIPGEKLFPARLGPGDPQDVEKAEAPGVDRYEDFPSEVLTLWGNFM